MVERNELMMKLVFVKSAKESERESIKEFWEFVGQHPELQPYIPPFATREKGEIAKKSTQTDRNEEFEVGIVSGTSKIRKKSGFDRSPLAVPPKYHENRIFRSKSLKLADEIEETYEDLNNELMAFEKRKETQESRKLETTDDDSWEEIILALSTEDFHSNQ